MEEANNHFVRESTEGVIWHRPEVASNAETASGQQPVRKQGS